MSSYTGLPEIVLSKKCAKFLMTRNAGERAELSKKAFLLEKAKAKEEKALQRERELIIRRQLKTLKAQQTQTTHCSFGRSNAANKASLQIERENRLWETSSDSALYTKERRKQRFSLNNCNASARFSTSNRSGEQNSTMPPEYSPRSVRSLSSVLPPIQPKSSDITYSAETVEWRSKTEKRVCMDKGRIDTMRK